MEGPVFTSTPWHFECQGVFCPIAIAVLALGIPSIRSAHSLCEHFALNDFVRGLTAVHFEPRKCLSAFWAVHVAVGMVFGDAI